MTLGDKGSLGEVDRDPNLVIVKNELLARLLCLTVDALQPVNVLHSYMG
jgi:hypothetical protein